MILICCDRKLIKHPGESLIKVFKFLPKYVSNQSLGRKIMDVLLLFLSKGAHNPGKKLQYLQ